MTATAHEAARQHRAQERQLTANRPVADRPVDRHQRDAARRGRQGPEGGAGSFLNTVAQTDLIVGARSGPTNLLLYSVLRIGNATNNVSWETYETLAAMDEVAWTIPISLGDSHRGFRVMGTTTDYFDHFGYGNNRTLAFDDGEEFDSVYDAVLGSDVASDLGYRLGDELIISHGLVSADFADHDDKPFTVVGILDKTGTPVDRTVHVSLAGIEAIHVDWQDGARPAVTLDAEQTLTFDLTPTSITAFMVGLENKALTFRVQRDINEYRGEPMSAIIPGATLAEFWRTISAVEQVLFVISALVLVAGFLGMLAAILSTLNEAAGDRRPASHRGPDLPRGDPDRARSGSGRCSGLPGRRRDAVRPAGDRPPHRGPPIRGRPGGDVAGPDPVADPDRCCRWGWRCGFDSRFCRIGLCLLLAACGSAETDGAAGDGDLPAYGASLDEWSEATGQGDGSTSAVNRSVTADYESLDWQDLVAPSFSGQDIAAQYRDRLATIEDGSPEADAFLQEMRDQYDGAAVNDELDGRKIQLAGFVAPLTYDADIVTEFLLVPYFGACIHVPPPPPHQTVLVTVDKENGLTIDESWGAVWVAGTLTVSPATTELAPVSYTMTDATSGAYEDY